MAIFTPYSAPNAPLIPQPGLLGGASPKAVTPAPQQQGIFSRILANLGTPQGLQILGSGLRDLGDGGNSLQALNQQILEQRRQQSADAWQRMQQEHAQQQWKAQDQQSQATDAAVAQIRPTLPPDQQRLLDADPQGYISRLVQQAAPGWQAGWDHAYRINPDGGTTLGGPIPHAPPSAASLMGTGTDAPFTPRPAGTPAPRAPRSVRTPQEAQALPPGTHYTTPDGREFVR